MKKTRILCCDHESEFSSLVLLPIPRDEIIAQLKKTTSELSFDPLDENFHYARIDGDPIVIHFFGSGNKVMKAACYQLVGVLLRRAIA